MRSPRKYSGFVRSSAKPASAAASFTCGAPATVMDETATAFDAGATTLIAAYALLVESQSFWDAFVVTRIAGAPGSPNE